VEGELLKFYRLDTGDKLLIPTELAEKAESERQRADDAEAKVAILAQRLRELGIDSDSL
jgi:hypothetical protein